MFRLINLKKKNRVCVRTFVRSYLFCGYNHKEDERHNTFIDRHTGRDITVEGIINDLVNTSEIKFAHIRPINTDENGYISV